MSSSHMAVTSAIAQADSASVAAQRTTDECSSCAKLTAQVSALVNIAQQSKRQITEFESFLHKASETKSQLSAALQRAQELALEVSSLRRVREDQARELAVLRSRVTSQQAAASLGDVPMVPKSRLDDVQWQLREAQRDAEHVKQSLEAEIYRLKSDHKAELAAAVKQAKEDKRAAAKQAKEDKRASVKAEEKPLSDSAPTPDAQRLSAKQRAKPAATKANAKKRRADADAEDPLVSTAPARVPWEDLDTMLANVGKEDSSSSISSSSSDSEEQFALDAPPASKAASFGPEPRVDGPPAAVPKPTSVRVDEPPVLSRATASTTVSTTVSTRAACVSVPKPTTTAPVPPVITAREFHERCVALSNTVLRAPLPLLAADEVAVEAEVKPAPFRIDLAFEELLRKAAVDSSAIDAEFVAWSARGVRVDDVVPLLCSRLLSHVDEMPRLVAVASRDHALLLAVMRHVVGVLVDAQSKPMGAARALLSFAIAALRATPRSAPLARMVAHDVISSRQFFEPQLVDSLLNAWPTLCADKSDSLTLTLAAMLRSWRARMPAQLTPHHELDVAACETALARIGPQLQQTPRDAARTLAARFFAALDASAAASPEHWHRVARICTPALQPQRSDAIGLLRTDAAAQRVIADLCQWPGDVLDVANCLYMLCVQAGWLWTWHRVIVDAVWPRLMSRGTASGAGDALTRHHALRLCAHLAGTAAKSYSSDCQWSLSALRTLCASVLLPVYRPPLTALVPPPPIAVSRDSALYIPHTGMQLIALDRALDVSAVVGFVEQLAAVQTTCALAFGKSKDLVVVRAWLDALSPSMRSLIPAHDLVSRLLVATPKKSEN
jgi:hypothetical protein